MSDRTIEHAVAWEPAEAGIDETAIDVYCWRLEQLLDAGFSHLVAEALAVDTAVDLHLACDLAARGCPEDVAYRILA